MDSIVGLKIEGVGGWEIFEIDQLGPDEVYVHLKDEDGGEYKGIITGVMDEDVGVCCRNGCEKCEQ